MAESSRIGVFGPAGVGKSTWISNFIKKYLEYYKDNKVYVFSPKLDDPAFKKIKNVHYVKLDDSLIKDPLDVSEFKDSICCFDDIESIYLTDFFVFGDFLSLFERWEALFLTVLYFSLLLPMALPCR